MVESVFKAATADIKDVVQSLQTYGCVLIRQAFPKEVIELIYERAKIVHQFRQNQFDAQQLPEAYQKFYRVGWVAFVSVRELDAPDEEAYQLINLFTKTRIPEFIRAFYDCQTCYVDPTNTVIRRVGFENPAMATPYHQDGLHRGGILPVLIGQPVLNTWVPLVDCGRDRPSLEVIKLRQPEQYPYDHTLDHPLYAYQVLNQEWVLEQFSAHRWFPEFERGDVMLMDQYTIHKTYIQPEMTQERLSIEIRTVPGDKLPNLNKDGLVKVS